MKTLAILIGNSDDKLTQKEWACYVLELRTCVENVDARIHFWGASVNYDPWQNLCCVCDVKEIRVELLKDLLTALRKRWKQDSAAMLVGESEFV